MDLNFPNTRDRTLEIRDVIHGSITLSEQERRVIDSPFFQRLRNIKQLGFSELAYPCATHNRYSHSIGAMYLAGKAFEQIFRYDSFSSRAVYQNYLEIVRLAMLLHDVGHGPLSHAIEFAMPMVADLKLPDAAVGKDKKRQATHEDFTLKILLDSSLTRVIEKNYSHSEITPAHVACVMNMDLPEPDDFFIDKNVNYRKLLHQMVSSEIDADRMDYLQRDSYYSGVSYGKYELNWLLSNLTYHTTPNDQDPRNPAVAHLALSNRAIYTFEDFLLSRYHMFLMVYYHHRSIVYEQMLERYLTGPDCDFKIPADIESYINYDDSFLWQHLRARSATNEWARRIAQYDPYVLTFELHASHNAANAERDPDLMALQDHLKRQKIDFIQTKNRGLMSKYTGGSSELRKQSEIFVMVSDRLTPERFVPLESFTELFRRYETEKFIVRIFTPEKIDRQAIPPA